MKLAESVLRHIRDHNMIAPGESILLALSGGPDSVALLNLLERLKSRLEISLSAVYINHGLRKKAARHEEQFCEKLCRRLGVPLEIVRADIRKVANSRRIGIEEAGREFRFETFERLSKEGPFDKVALGHHADDQVETVLFRLFRGTGPSGLTGMAPRRGIYIRPLLAVTKSDLIDYLRANNLTWCEDRSNESLDFSRNVIRRKILPEVTSRLNPQAHNAVLTLVEHVSLDESYFSQLATDLLRRTAKYSPGGKLNLDLARLRGYHRAIRRRLLRRCVLSSCDLPSGPDRDVIERIEDLLGEDSGKLSLPGGLVAEIAGNRLWFYRPELCKRVRFKDPVEFAQGRPLKIEWPQISLRTVAGARRVLKPARGRRVVQMDRDRIVMPLTVRLPKPGDRFGPLGMRGNKKLSDLFVDRKVPRPLREETLVVEDRQGIIWVVGVEIADRVKVSAAAKRVLQLEYRVRKGVRFPAV